MARPALSLGHFASILLLLAGSCGHSDGDGGSGGAENRGSGGTAGASGSGGASAELPDDGSDPNDLHACTGPGQCLLVEAARDCCVASCGEETIAFFSAIHRVHHDKWHEGQTCAGCLEPCSDEDRIAFTRSTTGVIAVCSEGHCEPFDTRRSDVTACATSADCQLRWGSLCCEDRTANRDTLTAVSDRNLLKDLTCAENFTSCGARPEYPNDAHAVCGTHGHCEVLLDSSDAGQTDASSSPGGDASDGSAAPDGDASSPSP